MIAITVEKNEVGPFLQVMAGKAADWTEPIKTVLESGLEDARNVITGGGPDFGWAPTSIWTQKVDAVFGRARSGQLRETGGLLASFRLFDVSPSSGSAGTDSPIASFQQEGTDTSFFILQYMKSHGKAREFGGRGVPPRPFLFWHEEKFEEYDRIFMDHLMAEGEGNA